MTLKNWVRAHGSMARAARELGVTEKTIFNWVHKKSKPTTAHFKKLTKATGLPTHVLINHFYK